MRISGEFPKINRVYNKNNGIKKFEKSSRIGYGGQDQISISNKGKDFQVVMKALKEVPDVRKDRVDDIEKKYNSGEYNVSGKDIIDKLVQSSGNEKINF